MKGLCTKGTSEAGRLLHTEISSQKYKWFSELTQLITAEQLDRCVHLARHLYSPGRPNPRLSHLEQQLRTLLYEEQISYCWGQAASRGLMIKKSQLHHRASLRTSIQVGRQRQGRGDALFWVSGSAHHTAGQVASRLLLNQSGPHHKQHSCLR